MKSMIRTRASLALIALLTQCLTTAFASEAFYDLDTPCNPISSITCALPYPSDAYAKEDIYSPTGLRLEYPLGAVREELLKDVPPSLTPQTVFNGSSGYSAATGVLFELDSPPDLNTIPGDGGESVIAFNLETGERVPLRVQLNEYARSDLVSGPSQIIEIFPRSRWNFEGRYAVYLTSNVKKQNGDDYQPSAGFANALYDQDSKIANYYKNSLEFFANQGYDPEELLSATFFTVRDEYEATGPLIELTQAVYAKEHPIRNLKVIHKLFGYVGAFVTGEIMVHNFRDQYGGMIYDTAQAEENWIKFRLTLPRMAKRGPVPIAIYGHGLSVFKESDLLVSFNNASLGIATVSIDHPNHGSRIQKDGGYVMARLDTPYVPLMAGMIAQSSIDHMALLKAVQTSIGELDVLPRRFWGPFVTTEINNADGIPEIDTSQIFYQGTSLGGVLGSTFVSLAPDIKGAFFQVSGAGITSILAGSALWDVAFSRLEPDAANGAEALLLKAAMQHELDYGDSINFVHFLRNPPPFADAKPVVLMAGNGDLVVPNFATQAFAEIAELPLINDPIFPMPGIEKLDDYDEGYGVLQFPSLSKTTSPTIDGLAAHGSFIRPEVRKAMNEWIRDFILAE